MLCIHCIYYAVYTLYIPNCVCIVYTMLRVYCVCYTACVLYMLYCVCIVYATLYMHCIYYVRMKQESDKLR